jgi:hypothetical protein
MLMPSQSEAEVASTRLAVQFWQLMYAKAKVMKPHELSSIGYPQNNPDADITIYEGFIGDLAVAMGLTRVKATRLVSILSEAQAITRLSRAGRNAPGFIQLNYMPTYGQLEQSNELTKQFVAKPIKTSRVLRQLTDLRSRVERLENIVRELQFKMNGG